MAGRTYEHHATGNPKTSAGTRSKIASFARRPAAPKFGSRRRRRDRARLDPRGRATARRDSRRPNPTEDRPLRSPKSSRTSRPPGQDSSQSTARSVAFHPLAESDLLRSLRFYEARRPGLGSALLRDLGKALDTISRYPLAAPVSGRALRRKVLARFPFSLFYSLQPGRILVVAVMNHRRHPAGPSDRL